MTEANTVDVPVFATEEEAQAFMDQQDAFEQQILDMTPEERAVFFSMPPEDQELYLINLSAGNDSE